MCYISFNELLGYDVPFNTISDGCKKSRQGKTKSWENKKDIDDKRKVWINLDTIPDGTRKKYNIPTGREYNLQRIAKLETDQEREKIERYENQQREIEIISNSEKLALRDAYNNHWIQYVSIYKERYSTNKDCDKLARQSAKEHAFWLEMIEVTGGSTRGQFGKAEVCFEYLLDLKKELIFTNSINNVTYFRRRLKDLRDRLKIGKNIVDVIANNKIGEKPHLQKFNDFHIGLVIFYVGHEKKYSYRLCTDLINQHCIDENQPQITESYIKTTMATDNEFRTLVFSRRNGTKYLKETILPHASRYPVEFPANLWMIDGTPMQFYCIGKNNKAVRLCLFVVLDAFSRKVVGYDIAYNEDKFMVMNALKMAVREEGHLPKEILSDNFSANKTEELIYIKEQMAKLGTNWRLCKVGNPQDKSQVERFFGVFQSEECVLYDDYIGEGIGGKRDNRPNAEFMAKNTKKPLSVEQMISRLITMVAKYNERVKRTRQSPLELYKLPKPKAVELDGFKTALMFWNRTKHTIRQGMVKITVNKVEHTFEIYSHKQKTQLQGKTVYVRYDTDNLDSVMLFDINNENAICECRKQIKVYVESDQSKDNLMKHTAKVNSYVNYIDTEIQKHYNNMLNETDKTELPTYTPLSLDKNQVNEQESIDTVERNKLHFGVNSDVSEPTPKPQLVITTDGIKKVNQTYEDGIVNKKSLGKASLKVVKTNDN
ncbi:transposase family protein [Flavobacterium psychrophilum]|nr:transposase family protein [Flavobacterium psychrophilum]